MPVEMPPQLPMPEPKKSSASLFLIFTLMVILVAALSVGYVYISGRSSGMNYTSGYEAPKSQPSSSESMGPNDLATINEDLGAAATDNFDSDFSDLQKDLSAL